MRASTVFAVIASAVMVSGAAIPTEVKRGEVKPVNNDVMEELTKILGSIVGNGNGNGNGNEAGNGNDFGNGNSAGDGNGNGNDFGNGNGSGNDVGGIGNGSGNIGR